MNIVSIIVSFLGGSFFGVVIKAISDHLTRKAQKEINSMQLKEKQQEIQLEWDNELRKLLGSYISHCYELNRMLKALNQGKSKLEDMNKSNSYEERIKLSEEAKKNIDAFTPEEVDKILKELSEIQSQITMYLFKEEPYSNAIRIALKGMNDKLMSLDADNSAELNVIIDTARNYFRNQWTITNEVIG